mgnify:CR=1 FL=1
MKHNFKKILCVLLACLMVIPFCTEFAKLPQIWAASSDIVDIPDVNMKAALNSALNVEDSSADITKEQLESLTALKLTGSDDTHITDYTGLEYCVNLKTLRITDSELTVLPDITALTKLHFLDLSDCYNLTDISKIPVTDTLNDVELEKCTSVNDISPLKAVPSITRLCLDGVKITAENADSNADTISSLTNLKYLDLAYAYVTDEYSSMFDSLTKLETLILAYNRFSNVDFLLSHNGTLKELTLYGCPVANDMTDTLGQMTSLKTLGISSTNIMDYRFMSRLPHLTNWSIRMAEGSDSFPTRPYTKIVKEFLPYTQETCVIDNPVIILTAHLSLRLKQTDTLLMRHPIRLYWIQHLWTAVPAYIIILTIILLLPRLRDMTLLCTRLLPFMSAKQVHRILLSFSPSRNPLRELPATVIL